MPGMMLSLVLLTAVPFQTPAPQADASSAIGGVLISPLLQRAQTRAGQTNVLSFALENPNQATQFADYEIKAFTVEPDTYRSVYVENHSRDCSAWFTGGAQSLSLAPGKRQDLKLSYKVPSGANGVYWAMLRFTPRPSGSTTKSQVVYEIPLVIVVGRNPRPVVEVGTPTVTDFPGQANGSTFMVSVPLENSGDGFIPVGVAGTVKNETSGQTVADLHVEDRNLLPHTKRHLGFAVPRLRDGRYLVSMKVTTGNRTLPPVTARYVVSKGVATLASEAAKVTQAPLVAEPSSLTLQMPAGSQRRSVIRITNNGSQPISIGVKTMDLNQTLTGSIEPVEPKEGGVEVSVAAETNRIEPGKTLVAQIEVSAPKGASGEQWFALQIVDVEHQDRLAETVIGTISIPGTSKPAVQVEQPNLVKDGDKVIAVEFRVRNSGNVALRPIGTAALLADGVRLVDRLSVPVVGDGGLLPGCFVTNTVMMPAAPQPGNYVVQFDYQYSEKDTAKLRVPITVGGAAKRMQAGRK